MNKEEYYPPTHGQEKFHCPHCNVYAKQRWSHLGAVGDAYTTRGQYGATYQSNVYNLTISTGTLPEDWSISFCEHCSNVVIWKEELIIYPKQIQVSQPNTDLSTEIQKDYLEAANVLRESPRSAAAILRLALQKLCQQLGEKGENINDDIASLVKKGLNPAIQKSLDSLRITGNNALHPGELDLTEDVERVLQLFKLLNFIAEKMLTEPKEINSFYDQLPEGAKEAVIKRDNSSK